MSTLIFLGYLLCGKGGLRISFPPSLLSIRFVSISYVNTIFLYSRSMELLVKRREGGLESKGRRTTRRDPAKGPSSTPFGKDGPKISGFPSVFIVFFHIFFYQLVLNCKCHLVSDAVTVSCFFWPKCISKNNLFHFRWFLTFFTVYSSPHIYLFWRYLVCRFIFPQEFDVFLLFQNS